MGMTEQEISRKIKEVVYKIDPTVEVILYGSRARKEATSESDWDIFILTEGSSGIAEEQKFRHALFDLELEVEQAISILLVSNEEWETWKNSVPLYQKIEREGVVL